MRSLVLRVAIQKEAPADWREVAGRVLQDEEVDLEWWDPHGPLPKDCDALVIDASLSEPIPSFRARFPCAALVAVAEQATPEQRLERIRLGCDEVVQRDQLSELYTLLRLSLERRKQEWNRFLSDGHLYQMQKLEAIGRMAAGVAHDVRHLAQITLGNCSLALRMASAADLQGMLGDARTSTEKSLQLVERLLRFVADEPYQGKRQRLVDWWRLQQPLVQAANSRRREMVVWEGESSWFNLDPSLLEQVFFNLVLNGLDALGRHGRLWLGFDTVEIGHPLHFPQGCLDRGTYGVLTVADDGEGIAPDSRQAIFEPFFTTKKDRGGTGLGLSTVLALLHSVGGNLVFDSVPGVGTSMRAFFPVCAEDLQPRLPLLEEPVLLLEANPEERFLQRGYLESLGVAAWEARDPSEARRLMRRHSPRTILADAHQFAGHTDSLGSPAEDCQRLITSVFPQSWLEHKGLLPPGWQYLARPWDLRQL